MDTTIESTNLQYRFAEMQSNLSYSYDIVVPTTLTPLQQMYLLLFYEYMENTQPSEDKKNIMASLIIIVEGKYPMTEVKRFPTILS
jgi:hypothetical protein